MNFFTKIYRFLWVILILLLVFFDRHNFYWVICTIILLMLLSFLAILRALESRNEWREYIMEEKIDDEIE